MMVSLESKSDRDTASREQPRRLLIAEAHRLLRWSLCTYLDRWFEVHAVRDVASAERVLSNGRIDALVLSDDLPAIAVERLEALAKARNPSLIIVRTIAGPPPARTESSTTAQLEKPFELATLARFLGVPNPAPPDNAPIETNSQEQSES